ncbi:hypothetical protein BCON_0144g00030 [Botryotinia convoluta]|uniref:Uncharacterized protein n=1 Tax=Botryotinia convoluta TaxID=54673 RepID=A0A4Z1HT57_9HELO|nr:hypothetical protein BCON_0144g00030 [Botryotinia convoluta]
MSLFVEVLPFLPRNACCLRSCKDHTDLRQPACKVAKPKTKTVTSLTIFKKIINQNTQNTQNVTKKQNILENNPVFHATNLLLLLLAIEQTQCQSLPLVGHAYKTSDRVFLLTRVPNR